MSDRPAESPGTASYVFDPSHVLRAAAPAALRAGGLIADAHCRAEEIILEARREAESIRREARAGGFEEGRAAALEEWRDLLRDAHEQRDEVLKQLEGYTANLESEMMQLALEVAEKVVRHEIDSSDEAVLRILRLAVRQVKDRANVRIWVNAADLERVRAARADIASWAEGLRDVEIGEEPRVERGGVIIESSDGILDARPSTQIDEIRRKLEGADCQ